MKIRSLCLLLTVATLIYAHPNFEASYGLIRSISADNGSAGHFHTGFYLRAFTEKREATLYNDSTGEAVHGGGDIFFGFGYSITDYLSFNVSSAYHGDGVDWEETDYNRASTGFGDTKVGLKLGLGSKTIKYGLYPFVSIATGHDRGPIDTTKLASYPIFNDAYANPGGVFRYFSSGGTDYGAIGLLTLRTGAMIVDLNLGYVLRNKAGGLRSNASIYNAALSWDLGDVVPFIEMSGIDYSGKDQLITFADDSVFGPNEVYITPGVSFRPGHFNIDFAVDIRAWEGENEAIFGNPMEPADSFNITTGWGVAPPWAGIFGISYCYDFIPEMPKYGDIAGTVKDSKTSEPISANVALYVEGTMVASKASDTEGAFTFPELEPGTYKLTAQATDYKPYTVDLLVKAGETTPISVALVPVPKEGTLVLNIIDLENKKQMAATVTVGDMEPEQTDGKYTKILKPGSYGLKVMATAPNYLPYERRVQIEAGKTLELEVALVKKEFKIVLPEVYFETAKSTIKPESYPILDGAAETIKTVFAGSPTVRIEIQGHTDSRGSDDYNLKLSQDRAQSVLDYLVINHELPVARLMARGYGESRPVASNDNPEGRQKNRRVEFVVLQ